MLMVIRQIFVDEWKFRFGLGKPHLKMVIFIVFNIKLALRIAI